MHPIQQHESYWQSFVASVKRRLKAIIYRDGRSWDALNCFLNARRMFAENLLIIVEKDLDICWERGMLRSSWYFLRKWNAKKLWIISLKEECWEAMKNCWEREMLRIFAEKEKCWEALNICWEAPCYLLRSSWKYAKLSCRWEVFELLNSSQHHSWDYFDICWEAFEENIFLRFSSF